LRLSLSLVLSAHPSRSAIYTLSLHDALPISRRCHRLPPERLGVRRPVREPDEPPIVRLRRPSGEPRAPALRKSNRVLEPRRLRRSEEHTSELQSRFDLVCRLLLEKKKKKYTT